MSLTVALSGSISQSSQALIGSKGLVVAAIDADLSNDEAVTAMDAQLETNRANCEGMDKAGSGLEDLVADSSSVRVVCEDKGPSKDIYFQSHARYFNVHTRFSWQDESVNVNGR